MSDSRVPLEYFMLASDRSLQYFAMNRLNQAANLEKEIKAMQSELLTLREAAGVAQWLVEHRAELLRTVGSHLENAGVSRITDAA